MKKLEKIKKNSYLQMRTLISKQLPLSSQVIFVSQSATVIPALSRSLLRVRDFDISNSRDLSSRVQVRATTTKLQFTVILDTAVVVCAVFSCTLLGFYILLDFVFGFCGICNVWHQMSQVSIIRSDLLKRVSIVFRIETFCCFLGNWLFCFNGSLVSFFFLFIFDFVKSNDNNRRKEIRLLNLSVLLLMDLEV